MYAVIETGGKQYRVQEGDVLSIEKLKVSAEEKIEFDKVLVLNDGKSVKVGTPYVDACKVFGTVVENGKGEKVIIFKYKAKKDYRKKQGHRQPYTMVRIDSLNGLPSEKKAEPKTEKKAEAIAVEAAVDGSDSEKAAAEKKPAAKKPAAKKATAEKADKPASDKKPAAKKTTKSEDVKSEDVKEV